MLRFMGLQRVRHDRATELKKCMATSIGQYTPVFLPGKAPTEKPGRPQSAGSQRVGHNQSNSVCIDASLFLVCGNSAPVRG